MRSRGVGRKHLGQRSNATSCPVLSALYPRARSSTLEFSDNPGRVEGKLGIAAAPHERRTFPRVHLPFVNPSTGRTTFHVGFRTMRVELLLTRTWPALWKACLPGTPVRLHIEENLEEAVFEILGSRFDAFVEHGDDALAEVHSDRLKGLRARVIELKLVNDSRAHSVGKLTSCALLSLELDHASAALVREAPGSGKLEQ